MSERKRLVFRTLSERLKKELPPPFPESEYRSRWERVRAAMAAAGVDTLFVSSPADICYLTGHQTAWYHDGGPAEWVPESGVALHVDAGEPIMFDDEDESLLAGSAACTPDLRVPPNTTVEAALRELGGLPPEKGAFTQDTAFIVDSLKKEGWLKGRVGLQLSHWRPSPAYSEVFRAALTAAGATVVDGTSIMPSVTRYKSPLELDCVREAARIGDAGFRAASEAMAEGVTEVEIWAAATSAMAAEGGELGGIPGMVNSGPKAASLHGIASRRRLERGDIINIDMCGVYNRYHCNLARSSYLGEPPAELREAMDKPRQVADAVRADMKPGMRFREILELDRRYASELGIWEDQWWIGGYDLGIAFPPDWVGYHYFSAELDPGDQALEPGMVMNHEWNFYLPGGAGIRELIDTLIVTEDGVEFPHRIPLGLNVVDAGA